MVSALPTCNPWSHGGCSQGQGNSRHLCIRAVSISPLKGGEEENVVEKKLPPRSRPQVLKQVPKYTKWTPQFSRIDEVIKIINSNDNLEAALEGWSKPLSAKNIVTVVNNINKWEKALKFFEWLKARDDMYEINKYTYNVVLKALRNGRQLSICEKLVDEMAARGIPPDNHTFSTMINCAKRCNQIDVALRWFEKMKAAGIPPDEVTYNALIDILGRAGRISEAVELYEKLRSANWKLDAVTYGALANAYASVGDYQSITQLLHEMKELGLRPNAVFLNTLIGALSKAGKINHAKKVFGDMTTYGVDPTPVTLSIMIEMYSRVGGYDQAFQMYDKIKAEGWKCDVAVYNSLLKACVEGGRVKEAEDVLQDIEKFGCKPSHLTYRTAMNTYASCGDVGKARDMFDKVVKLVGKPDTPLYTVLIRACKQAGDMKQIGEAFKEMTSRNCSPDDRLCGMLLSCVTCCRDDPGDEKIILECLEAASPLLHELLVFLLARDFDGEKMSQKVENFISKYAGTASRKPLCNCLMDICWNSGMKDEARKIFKIGVAVGAFEGLQTSLPSLWRLNLRKLSFTAAEIALEAWLSSMRLTVVDRGDELPEDLIIETGAGKARSGQRLNLVVADILGKMGVPFTMNTDPSGYFYATGEALEGWIKSRVHDSQNGVPALPLTEI